MPDETCLWCDEIATAFCDAILGMDREGRERWSLDDQVFTCDAPMCATHRMVTGFLCDKKDPDTFDKCPYHAPDNESSSLKNIDSPSAAVMRREVIADARRRRFTPVCQERGQ